MVLNIADTLTMLLQVPFADFNSLLLPSGTEHEADFALLADIFPTGMYPLHLEGIEPGTSRAASSPVAVMQADSHASYRLAWT